ncbi:TonB-dependent receptor [Sulfurimonas crateris]|uniref:TonB-dependent receptor n=1 Tax=Sulfurimonas crateris TaxID=2574727 RepID=A0A4V5TM49_9BACT|nr:TonB-dependent receptor [Sulfurimonas crateris]TKI70403.1 TonB-dependent receptor [Sulfurimonas crateris]
MIRILLLLFSLLFSQMQALANSDSLFDKSLEELLDLETETKADVGSRSGKRDMTFSEVPIDVITSEQIRQSGATELTRVLSRFIPGFNAPRSSITDGTDHVKTFTLRGLDPDQVLVLINGKRMHQSSLTHTNGTIGRGTSNVDLNTIPLVSIDRIEFLRDSAAAQYGSDAIAGVINIILKGFAYESEANLRYGETSKGDGALKQSDFFYSIPLEYDGFFNISGEIRDRASTNRAGADSRDNYIVNTHYGDPDTLDKILAINGEVVMKNGNIVYMHGLYNKRESEAGAFYRLEGDAANNINIYPDGFLPMIAPKIEDYSFTIGSKGVMGRDLSWDASYTRGYNDFHFFVYNTHNDSLGESSPTSFDSGGTKYTQDILNLDFSTKVKELTVAFGAEFKMENYRIYSGEEGSYILGSASTLAGAQGFPGFQPQNETDKSRKNGALYLDLKYNSTKDLTFGAASRYEKNSDFGATWDQKISATYKPTQSTMLRSSASTGFRAPSLTQSYYTHTVMATSGIDIVQKGTFATDHPLSVALGATPLDAEKSTHFSAGLVYAPTSDFSLSLDYFYTKIDDRIMLSRNISFDEDASLTPIFNLYGVQQARYFTNALDTETDGFDLRMSYKHQFKNSSNLKTGLSYHRNSTKVVGAKDSFLTSGIIGATSLAEAKAVIEKSQPNDDLKIWAQYFLKNYAFALNLNRYGSYEHLFAGETNKFGAKWTTDAEISYEISKKLNFAIGAENLFDVYPDKWSDTYNPLIGEDSIIQYSQYSPFGVNGAFYYVRVGVKF